MHEGMYKTSLMYTMMFAWFRGHNWRVVPRMHMNTLACVEWLLLCNGTTIHKQMLGIHFCKASFGYCVYQ